MQSLKNKSRFVTLITTVVIALLTYIATMQPDVLATYLPGYERFAPLVIVIAAALVNQYSEEKRVTRAEEIAMNKTTKIFGFPLDEVEDEAEEVEI